MLALLSPGQGAQSPGFLTPWLALPNLAHRLDWFSAVVGRDLSWLGTAGSEEEIRDTAACQPLLVAVALAVTEELGPAGVYAGHSVGELAAASLAGSLSPEAALVLARERGAAMAEASAATPTGMAAVLGGTVEAIEAAGLVVANHNGAGQLVAAGPLDAAANLTIEGARVIPLRVAGAFHTAYMAPARDRLARMAIPAKDPAAILLSNADGAVVSTGADLRARLVAQVASPVRWDLCLETLGDLGVTKIVELPPAGTLSALVRRVLPGVEVVALKSPADLAAARALLDDPAPPPPPWRLVVAPVKGVFAPLDVTTLAPGDALGRVADTEVVAPYGGVVVEWLVSDGDPVRPGQPLVRLHPVAE